MRERERILASLETAYREALEGARELGDQDRMKRLDFEFQRDQIYLEVLMDLRDLMNVSEVPAAEAPTSLLERAQALRSLTRKLK